MKSHKKVSVEGAGGGTMDFKIYAALENDDDAYELVKINGKSIIKDKDDFSFMMAP